MLRPLLAQLGRCEGSGLRQLAAAASRSTQGAWRSFSSSDEQPTSSGGEEGVGAAAGASSSAARPPRLQTKEWRSWIDTKLDSKLEALQEGSTDAEPTAEESAGVTQRHADIADALAAAPAEPAPPRSLQPKQPKAPPAPAAAAKARGFDLQQQIYSIVTPARPSTEEGPLPEGVTSYAQLAMAADAPRFERGAHNIADMSPQRIHPTRLFYPAQFYAPGELDPYKSGGTVHDFDQTPPPPANPDEVTRLADFKNAPLLASFLSEAGKLPLRRKTQLRAKLHRHLARQVKIARQMAVLSPTERWHPSEQARQQQRRQRGSTQRRY